MPVQKLFSSAPFAALCSHIYTTTNNKNIEWVSVCCHSWFLYTHSLLSSFFHEDIIQQLLNYKSAETVDHVVFVLPAGFYPFTPDQPSPQAEPDTPKWWKELLQMMAKSKHTFIFGHDAATNPHKDRYTPQYALMISPEAKLAYPNAYNAAHQNAQYSHSYFATWASVVSDASNHTSQLYWIKRGYTDLPARVFSLFDAQFILFVCGEMTGSTTENNGPYYQTRDGKEKHYLDPHTCTRSNTTSPTADTLSKSPDILVDLAHRFVSGTVDPDKSTPPRYVHQKAMEQFCSGHPNRMAILAHMHTFENHYKHNSEWIAYGTNEAFMWV